MAEKVGNGVAVVLIGAFNPAIFQPAWFEKNDLLPSSETEGASIETISNDIALLTMSWVRIEVIHSRFVARTQDESRFGLLRDLIVGTFTILEHTPVSQLGINWDHQYRVPNEDAWHKVGHTLAPKAPWAPFLTKPGMVWLTINAPRDDGRKGMINVTVKPVLKKPMEDWRIDVSFNDHIELDEEHGALDACKVLEADWEASQLRAADLSYGLISETSK